MAVVPDRDVLAHDLLADPARHEAALLDEGAGAEGEVREVVHDVGDGVLLEDDVVVAGLQLVRVDAAPCLVDGLGCERGAVDFVHVEGPALGVPRRRLAHDDGVDVGRGVIVVGPDAEAVHDRDLALARPEGAGGDEARSLRGVANGAHDLSAALRSALGGLAQAGRDLRDDGGAGERHEVLVVLLQPGDLHGALSHGAQSALAHIVRSRDPDLLADDGSDAHLSGGLLHVLVDVVVGEARQR